MIGTFSCRVCVERDGIESASVVEHRCTDERTGKHFTANVCAHCLEAGRETRVTCRTFSRRLRSIHRTSTVIRRHSGPRIAHRESQNSFTAAVTLLLMMSRRSGESILSSSSRLMIEPASSRTAGIRVDRSTNSSS
jgi:hypothetical protein